MGFYFQDDFWEACEELSPTASKKDRDTAVAAIVAYYFTSDEPSIKGAPKAIFIAFRDRIDMARKKSNAGKSNADQNEIKTAIKRESNENQNSNQNEIKTESNGQSNADQNEIKSGCHLLKRERESKSEKDHEEPPLPPFEDQNNESAAFAVEALSAFNEITESDIRDIRGDTWLGLRRIFDAGRTIDDVRSVIEKKYAEWKDDPKMAKFVRPSTLFGEKFDEYLNQKTEGGHVNEEVSEYAGLF